MRVQPDIETSQLLLDDRALAQRRPRRNDRKLPLRFRDILPQALPPASNLVDIQHDPIAETSLDPKASSDSEHLSPITCPVDSGHEKPFMTGRNIFGLFRKYFSSNQLSHDPEEYLGLRELSEDHAPDHGTVDDPSKSNSRLSPDGPLNFLPYPNVTSYQLGHWYWNGAQKSQQGFDELIKIIGSPSYRPEDIQDVLWTKINTILASDTTDVEWLDTVAGWKCTPIKISVPFHQRTSSPGPKYYIAGDLFHRSLVSVLREKFSDPENAQGIHYEPFELFWQPGEENTKTRVHGELYTSHVFARTHQQLMNSPREPNCHLPRAIAAIMLWSDATLLTSYGDAKLWACYLFLGNETKYQRSKPSCHLCSHLAYFIAVSDVISNFSLPILCLVFTYTCFCSFQILSRILCLFIPTARV